MSLRELSFERERALTQGGYRGRSVWHGAAFVMEALLLLFFLVVSLTIFMTLFSNASSMGEHNDRLAHAITIATNAAEKFTADPTQAPASSEVDGYKVDCSVKNDTNAAGTLYTATITVSVDSEEIYTLEASSYKSGGGA